MKEWCKNENPRGGIWKKTMIIVIWLVIWQIVCLLVDNPIFFAGPLEALKELAHMVCFGNFWNSVFHSLLRITGGFLAAFFFACLLSAAAYRIGLLEDFLSPFVTLMKTVPVASVVVMLLIWFGADYLSVYITFMVVFPNIYLNVLNGLKNTDRDLLEMAEVFRLSFFQKLFYIYCPSVMPYLLAGASVSVGMSFKSGVAAEVIGLPVSSIGEGLYNAKIYLNTAGVFAWTVVIIVLASLVERLVTGLLKQFGRQELRLIKRKPYVPAHTSEAKTKKSCLSAQVLDHKTKSSVLLEDVTVSFGEKTVLDHIHTGFDADGIYCIMGPSGCGKTTLLRVCAGLQKTTDGRVYYKTIPDGDICGKNKEIKEISEQETKIGMAFQENRLCLQLSALNNLLLTADRQYSAEEIVSFVGEIFPEEALQQPAGELSGGMKRRIEVARAVLSDADCLLLDEPFAGLDEANHERLMRWILKNRNGRLLIFTTHEEADAGRMDASVLRLPE